MNNFEMMLQEFFTDETTQEKSNLRAKRRIEKRTYRKHILAIKAEKKNKNKHSIAVKKCAIM